MAEKNLTIESTLDENPIYCGFTSALFPLTSFIEILNRGGENNREMAAVLGAIEDDICDSFRFFLKEEVLARGVVEEGE